METPLAREVLARPGGDRPAGFHPTKELVFASAPESAPALQQSGVDVVALGNNHVYDALEGGLDSTLKALDRAGLPHFGAGRTVAEAWAPALVREKAQTLAFLGCTTVEGKPGETPYVAGPSQGGAASCSDERLSQEVRAAAVVADAVVVQIHGGVEYRPTTTDEIRRLTRVATDAGAALVVNGHPHVVGGITTTEQALVAESTGNLLFDQTVWPTFLSYLLRVDLRSGAPVLATTDPMVIQDYVPRPTVGLLADAASRRAAGLLPGNARLQQPGAVVWPALTPESAPLEQTLPSGALARLAPGWWVDENQPAGASADLDLGEDLLWSTGLFEDMDTDPATRGGHLWAFGRDTELTQRAACSGSLGVELLRAPVGVSDVIVTPQHRQLVSSGQRLSLFARVRQASEGAFLELRWYTGSGRRSATVIREKIPKGDYRDDCALVRIDAVVPDGVVAAQPFLRLVPSRSGHLSRRLAADDVQLVAWREPGDSGRRFGVIGVRQAQSVRFRKDSAATAAQSNRSFEILSRSEP